MRFQPSSVLHLIVLLSVATPALAANVRGRITDAQSQAPVGQAEVVLVSTAYRAFSEDDGTFTLKDVAAGNYTLSVARMGYAPLRRSLEVGAADTTLDLPLTPSAVKLEEINVTPGTFSFMGQGTGTRQTLSREDIEAVPQIGNDIFRAINRLPGLASNDYAAHFGIRGGRHDETLILLDGLELYEPYHLKDFNEGAISIIDAQTIDAVQLMTGGFPARYGNKRSGVFDITSRTPETDRTSVDLNSSLMNTSVMARGPLLNDRSSWLAFGRIGYMGPVFTFIDQADLPQPDYEDVFAKVGYQLSTKHHLSLEFLHAGDRYQYEIAGTTGFEDTINTREVANNEYRNSYAWATLKSTLSPRITVRTLVSTGAIKRSRDGYERNLLLNAPYYLITNERTYTTTGAAQDWTLSLSDDNLVSFGVDYRAQHNQDRSQSIIYQDPDDPEAPDPGEFPIVTNSRIDTTGSRLAFYLSDRWRVVKPLVVEVGARYDRASWTGDEDVSPRVGMAMDLGRGMTARFGWGRYRQMQGIDDVSSLDATHQYYRSELSEQWTAGWERVGAKNSLIRLEGYYKRGSHLRPVFRNWKGAIDVFPESNEDRIEVFPGTNTSRGIEIYFDRPIAEHVTARVSYSYAIADEDVIRMVNVNSNDSLPYDLSHPGPQDQSHAANADLTYRIHRWSLNGSFAYHSGWPSTEEHLVSVINSNGQPEQTLRPIKVYGQRLPSYLRLDLRAMRDWQTHWGRFGTWLEVINLTNNANVFGYDYFRKRDAAGQITLEREDETWFSIFPSLGISWSMRF